jgi:N-acetylglutamate synthase-like GNAT family acetyltransferase
MRQKVRRAIHEDMDRIYLMGFDVWGKGESIEGYLDSCRRSPKYKKGEWYLLEHGEHGPIASLILFRFTGDSAGLGSIATVPEKRGQGFGAYLIKTMVEYLDLRCTRATFLFSDISPHYYARFGFRALPPEHQKHPGSVCMIRAESMDSFLKSPDFRPPTYF